MGMITRTESGKVVSKNRDSLSILLEKGNIINITMINPKLKLGCDCQVSFNNTTGKPIKILLPEQIEDVLQKQDNPNDNEYDLIQSTSISLEEEEFSRRQKCEEMESEEYEY